MALPIDLELAAGLLEMNVQTPYNTQDLEKMRESLQQGPNEILSQFPDIMHEEGVVPGSSGDVVVSIFRRKHSQQKIAPAICYIHPGGVILGNRFLDVSVALEWVQQVGAVCVSVEYRLAPEYPGMCALEDCYATLEWMSKNSQLLGFDASMIVVMGVSGGGGLAAGLCLLCQHRDGPRIAAQVLVCPMLDPDNSTNSACQPVPNGLWDQKSNAFAWDSILGTSRREQDISKYLAPSRASLVDMQGLPSTFIDVGECEIFRDECVAYASKLWAAGVSTDLHVWSGGFHGFDLNVPKAMISMAAKRSRNAWFSRWLAYQLQARSAQDFETADIPAFIKKAKEPSSVL